MILIALVFSGCVDRPEATESEGEVEEEGERGGILGHVMNVGETYLPESELGIEVGDEDADEEVGIGEVGEENEEETEEIGPPVMVNPMVISWEKTNGPGGGKIIDVAIDPENSDILYTAAYPISKGLLDGGIYKSLDGGESWDRKINGINDKETWSVSLDPNDNGVLWAGTNSGEIYKSNDGAESWELKKEARGDIWNPTSDTIYSIEIDPFDSDRVLAGSREGNLFLTEDGGRSWERIYNRKGLTLSGVISDITFDPRNEGIVYLTSGFFDVWDFIGNGIFKSEDGGKNWRKLENGLQGKKQFGDLVIDPSNSNVLYAANGMETNRELGVEGEDLAHLLRSEDAGESWEIIDIGRIHGGRTLNAVAVHPTNPDRIYVLGQDQSVFISEDRGISWEALNETGLIGIGTFVEYDPNNYDVMYATSYAAGVFKSTDAGRSWKASNGKEISFAYVEGMEADPKKKGWVYTQSFENGFHYSDDFGESWKRGTVSGNRGVWTSFVEKGKKGETVYVVSKGGGDVKRASTPGAEWQWINIGGHHRALHALTLEASDFEEGLIFAGTRENGIYKSENAGNDWRKLENGLPYGLEVRSIAIDPNNEEKVYAGSVSGKGRIWVSEDKGENWNLLNEEMHFTTIHAMQSDPRNEGVIYAAPWGTGLFKSEDGGRNWNEVGKGRDDSMEAFSIADIKVHPEDSDMVYATSRATCNIVRSDNGGETWRDGFGEVDCDEYFRLNSFTFDPSDPEIYYFSAWKMNGLMVEGDLFRRGHEGIEKVTNGLPRAVLDLEIDPEDRHEMYASTHLYGLFKSEDMGDSWEEVNSFPRVGAFDLAFNEGNLYAATGCGELPEHMMRGMPQPEGDCGLYKSEDEGGSWSNLLPEELRGSSVKQIAFNEGKVYIATDNDAFVSEDGGNWEALNVPFKETSAIKVSGGKVFVGTHGGGVYQKEIDSGEWENYGPYADLLNIQVTVDKDNSDVIYASSFPGGVFKSADGGKTWNEKNFALPSFRVENPELQAYYSFSINPRNSNNLFLGLFGKGAYMSLDGANTWMPINKGLDNKEIYNIQVDASGEYAYAATNGGSVHKTKLN